MRGEAWFVGVKRGGVLLVGSEVVLVSDLWSCLAEQPASRWVWLTGVWGVRKRTERRPFCAISALLQR